MPNSPFGLNPVVMSDTSLKVSFYDNANNESEFIVQRAGGKSGKFKTLTTLPAAKGTKRQVSFTDNAIVSGTTYQYQVFAVSGNRQSSVDATSVTAPIITPKKKPATAHTAVKAKGIFA